MIERSHLSAFLGRGAKKGKSSARERSLVAAYFHQGKEKEEKGTKSNLRKEKRKGEGKSGLALAIRPPELVEIERKEKKRKKRGEGEKVEGKGKGDGGLTSHRTRHWLPWRAFAKEEGREKKRGGFPRKKGGRSLILQL